MMLMFNLKCFILILLGLFIFQQNIHFINTVKLQTQQNIPADLNNMSAADLEKLAAKEGVSLDQNAPVVAPAVPEAKEPQSAEELMKSLSSISSGDISKLNMEELKGLAGDDKTYEGKSCDSIKRMGQQKDYCEKKYLLSEGEEKTVECMKSFCTDCCRGVESCETRCHKSHALFGEHDPEEMLISVCSYKDQGPQFKGFCKSMLTESDPKEYDNCLTNFCFDCCSNELKINDQNDPEIMKCLEGCKPPKPKQEDTEGGEGQPPVPGTKGAEMMMQADKEMMEASQKEDKDTQRQKDSLVKDLKNDNSKDQDEEIKVLADFGGKKQSEEIKKEEDSMKSKSKESENKNDENENLLIDFEKQDQDKTKKIDSINLNSLSNKNSDKSNEEIYEQKEKSKSHNKKPNEILNKEESRNHEKDDILKNQEYKNMENKTLTKTIKKRVNKNDSSEQAKLEKIHNKKSYSESEMGEADKLINKEKEKIQKSHKSSKSHIKFKKISFSERTKGIYKLYYYFHIL